MFIGFGGINFPPYYELPHAGGAVTSFEFNISSILMIDKT